MNNRRDRSSTTIPKVCFLLFNLETSPGTMWELATQHVLLQPCGLDSVACMWPEWGDVTVQALIDLVE